MIIRHAKREEETVLDAVSCNDDITLDRRTGEMSSSFGRVRVFFPEFEEPEDHRCIRIAVNGRNIYVTRGELKALSVYFKMFQHAEAYR